MNRHTKHSYSTATFVSSRVWRNGWSSHTEGTGTHTLHGRSTEEHLENKSSPRTEQRRTHPHALMQKCTCTEKSCHPTHRPHMAMCVYNCTAESYYMDQYDTPLISSAG